VLALGIICAIGASALYNTSVALQALEAREVGHEHALRASLIGRLIRNPRWLLATLIGLLGWPLEIAALLRAGPEFGVAYSLFRTINHADEVLGRTPGNLMPLLRGNHFAQRGQGGRRGLAVGDGPIFFSEARLHRFGPREQITSCVQQIFQSQLAQLPP